MGEYTGRNVFSNALWRFAERCGAQGVKFIVELVLARILMPEDYGVIAIVTVIINILNVFIDSGLGSALIQKKDADDIDFSSVFYFNVFVCFILYGILFISAPIIANYYANNELMPIVRVLGVTLIISGIKNVQQAYVSKYMKFKKFFIATLIGTIGAAILGIAFALHGFGVWALVIQQIFNVAIDTVVLWFVVDWRPKLVFSMLRLRKLLGYGWKLLASALINAVTENIRTLVIGKVYTESSLAFYNQGHRIPSVVIGNISNSMDSVLLPSMSSEQEDKKRVRSMAKRAIQVSVFVIAPILMGVSSCATSIVKLFLTEKWLPCVFFLRIFCFTFMFYPIHTVNLSVLKSLGRSGYFLKLEVIKVLVTFSVLIITMNISLEVMAYSAVVTNVINQVINCWPNRKLIDYGWARQVADILPEILLAISMGIIVYLIGLTPINYVILLIFQVVTGMAFYFGIAYKLKNEAMLYIIELLKSYHERRHG